MHLHTLNYSIGKALLQVHFMGRYVNWFDNFPETSYNRKHMVRVQEASA